MENFLDVGCGGLLDILPRDIPANEIFHHSHLDHFKPTGIYPGERLYRDVYIECNTVKGYLMAYSDSNTSQLFLADPYTPIRRITLSVDPKICGGTHHNLFKCPNKLHDFPSP